MDIQLRAVVERDIMSLLTVLLADEPAILIQGPRGSGKSTVLKALAERHGGRLLDLDDDAVLARVRDDPFGTLNSDGPVLIDEFQREPRTLSAVKRMVDADPRPGRCVLAGSVSSGLLPIGSETLTGRVHRLLLPPLSTGEILATTDRVIPRLLSGQRRSRFDSAISRRQYFDLIVAGGYPAALLRPGAARRARWFSSYLGAVAERDLPSLVDVRHPAGLARLYRLIAQQTSGQLVVTKLADQLKMSPVATRSYLDLLLDVYLVRELPGWTAGVSAKTGRRPKLHVWDTGLAAAALGMDAARLASSGLAGSFMESFVVGEIGKQLAVVDEAVMVAHFRDRSGIEVDMIIERLDGSVLAIEVKSATSVNQADARGLRFLRDRLGDRFIRGILFHTGPLASSMDDRIDALPVSVLWGEYAPASTG